MRTMAWAAAVVVALAGVAAVNADDKETPTTKEIMKKLHGGNDALLKATQTKLKAGTVDWDAVQTDSKTIKELGEAMGKNEVKKGTKESWEKLTKAYADTATKLSEAAEKKDKAAATQSLTKLGGSCMACHRVHK